MKANKLIAKVDDPAVLKDIAKALPIDLNNFIPTESSLVEKLESPTASEEIALKRRETKEFLVSVRSALYALKLVYCDEQLERLQEFEKTALAILREFANTATQNASPPETEANKNSHQQKLPLHSRGK